MMLSLPSVAPRVFCIGTLGTLKPALAFEPPPPPAPPPPPLSPPPHPAATNSATQATTAAHVARLVIVVLPPGTGLRLLRTSAPRARPPALGAREAPEPPARRSRGSGARPAAPRRRRARPGSA